MMALVRTSFALTFVSSMLSLFAPACGSSDDGADVGTTTTTDTTTATETSAGDATTETAADTTEPVDTSAVDTAEPVDTSAVDTAEPVDTSAVDTADTSDTSAVDTADTSDTGPGASCEQAGDCAWCAFGTAPTSTDECYCIICAGTLTTADTCAANQLAWDTHCAGEKWAATAECPVPRCLAPDPLACIGGECINGCAQSECPSLDCPEAEQEKPPGECCARCVGDSACTGDGDCNLCLYDKPIVTVDDCYCTLCPKPVEEATCEANRKKYVELCDPWPKPEQCPVPICLQQGWPVCELGQCERNPDGCFLAEDCTLCAGTIATHAGECQCPGCPTAHSKEYCDAVELAEITVCDGFDFASCPALPCAEPPPVVCMDSAVCGFQEPR